MMWKNRTIITWSAVLLMLLAITLLAACASQEQILLAEFNRAGEAEIFLTQIGAEKSEWQSLVEDVERSLLFPGELAAFVPDTNRILLWYTDGNDLRVEQMKMGDDAPSEIFEADQDARIFATFTTDPFAIFLSDMRNFDDYRCYISLEGGKAERLARSNRCFVTAAGGLTFDRDRDRAVTSTFISADGEKETVLLDEVENVVDVRPNEAMSQFVYVIADQDEAQAYLIKPGDEEGTVLGEAFNEIETFGFLPDGETVYVFGKLDEDDEGFGLYLNAAGEPLLEANSLFLYGQPENTGSVVWLASQDNEQSASVYNLADETLVDIVEEDEVSFSGFVGDGRFLLTTQRGNEYTLLSVSRDGNDVVELLSTDEHQIFTIQVNQAAEQLLVHLVGEDRADTLFVTSVTEDDGYFLLEDWDAVTVLTASADYLVFAGREDPGDDLALYSIPWEPDAAEIELDDDAGFAYQKAFFAANGRSLYYTMLDRGIDDTEVRLVPVDGSERPETLYRDMVLLDVQWNGEPNLQFVR